MGAMTITTTPTFSDFSAIARAYALMKRASDLDLENLDTIEGDAQLALAMILVQGAVLSADEVLPPEELVPRLTTIHACLDAAAAAAFEWEAPSDYREEADVFRRQLLDVTAATGDPDA